jgi:hypothetical protein
MTAQPQDEWTYLRPEEFADDDAVERIDAACTTSPEEQAVHLLDPASEPRPATVLDTGETLVRPAPGDPSVRYFDDEEPEDRGSPDADETDTEPRVDELLVSQHYAFDAETSSEGDRP